jgi:hypothetical protein
VSCYAFFKGWLLLSQPPHCQRNFTTLSALSIDLGTLTGDPDCSPLDERSLAPAVLLPDNLPRTNFASDLPREARVANSHIPIRGAALRLSRARLFGVRTAQNYSEAKLVRGEL